MSPCSSSLLPTFYEVLNVQQWDNPRWSSAHEKHFIYNTQKTIINFLPHAVQEPALLICSLKPCLHNSLNQNKEPPPRNLVRSLKATQPLSEEPKAVKRQPGARQHHRRGHPAQPAPTARRGGQAAAGDAERGPAHGPSPGPARPGRPPSSPGGCATPRPAAPRPRLSCHRGGEVAPPNPWEDPGGARGLPPLPGGRGEGWPAALPCPARGSAVTHQQPAAHPAPHLPPAAALGHKRRRFRRNAARTERAVLRPRPAAAFDACTVTATALRAAQGKGELPAGPAPLHDGKRSSAAAVLPAAILPRGRAHRPGPYCTLSVCYLEWKCLYRLLQGTKPPTTQREISR